MAGIGSRVGLVLAVALAWVAGAGEPALAVAPAASPALHFAASAGTGIAVAGAGWRPRSPVIFWVTAGDMNRGVELITRKNGSFVIGIQGLTLCARPTFLARDLRRGRARLEGPPLACAQPLTVPPAQLRILAGKPARPAVVRMYGNSPNTVSMHLGDELYVWEPSASSSLQGGTGVAAFTPHADAGYLVEVHEGPTPPRACPQPDCAMGFNWLYVAVKAGRTALIISPACRQATPPCLAPDFVIPVVIST